MAVAIRAHTRALENESSLPATTLIIGLLQSATPLNIEVADEQGAVVSYFGRFSPLHC